MSVPKARPSAWVKCKACGGNGEINYGEGVCGQGDSWGPCEDHVESTALWQREWLLVSWMAGVSRGASPKVMRIIARAMGVEL